MTLIKQMQNYRRWTPPSSRRLVAELGAKRGPWRGAPSTPLSEATGPQHSGASSFSTDITRKAHWESVIARLRHCEGQQLQPPRSTGEEGKFSAPPSHPGAAVRGGHFSACCLPTSSTVAWCPRCHCVMVLPCGVLVGSVSGCVQF